MAMIKHNYPQSQHQGMTPVGSTFAPDPAQPNQQQMLAQALRGSGGMPQQQLSEEEKMIIMQLMQQGMTQEQAMQELMRMKSVA
jgi:predicted Zn-dependent protease